LELANFTSFLDALRLWDSDYPIRVSSCSPCTIAKRKFRHRLKKNSFSGLVSQIFNCLQTWTNASLTTEDVSTSAGTYRAVTDVLVPAVTNCHRIIELVLVCCNVGVALSLGDTWQERQKLKTMIT